MTELELKFKEKVDTPSDINEHLMTLLQFGGLCKHITEMGVRNPTSTYAFLVARPEKLISYDIARWEGVDEAERLAKQEGINFEFKLEDVLKADIEETDFLFVDTWHDAGQLSRELEKHSAKVRRFIGMHDTETYGRKSEEWYPGVPSEVITGKGLLFALEDFLDKGGWRIVFQTPINNGLTIIERV